VRKQQEHRDLEEALKALNRRVTIRSAFKGHSGCSIGSESVRRKVRKVSVASTASQM
jgi:hypothetical protein